MSARTSLARRIAGANPISLLGQGLRNEDVRWPEPRVQRFAPVVIPGGPKAPRPRQRPLRPLGGSHL